MTTKTGRSSACQVRQDDRLQRADPLEARDRRVHFSGGRANLATVKVPDPRLDVLTAMFKPKRKVPADVQYLDVAGVAKGMAEKGMGGQLLGHLAQADALVQVVRAFEDTQRAASRGARRSARDIETIYLELTFSDLAIIEKRLRRIAAQSQAARHGAGSPRARGGGPRDAQAGPRSGNADPRGREALEPRMTSSCAASAS